jgi:hypothetical protein
MNRRRMLSKSLGAAAGIGTGKVLGSPENPQETEQNRSQVSNSNPSSNRSEEATKYSEQKIGTLAQKKIAGPQGGNDPLPRDDKAWKSIIDAADIFYLLTSDQSLGSPLDRNLLRLDAGFVFTKQAADTSFKENQVEELLGSAAILVDRGLRDRHDWQEKAALRFTVASEILEYRLLDMVHQQETAAGFYTVPAIEAQAMSQAENELVIGNSTISNYFDWLLKTLYTNEKLNEQSGAYQLMAWLAHLAAYQFPNGGELLQHRWNGNPNTSPVFMRDAAFLTSWHAFNTQILGFMAQRRNHGMLYTSANERSAGLSSRSNWERMDVNFKRSRTEAARRIADLKARAFTEKGGELNYSEQMEPIADRFNRDFRDALARVFVAIQGMIDIYGYDVPLPAQLMAVRDGKKHDNLHDSAVVWLRDAVAWLTAFSYADQNYTLPVSLRGSMTKDTWSEGRKAGKWDFDINEERFPTQRHVRLRGVSAFVVFDQGTSDWERDSSIWNVVIRAPQTATYHHLSNKTVTVNQSYLPPARLGRVALRSAIQPADITAVSAFHNASPIGRWQLAISKKAINGINLDRVKDIHLDLHLAVQAAPDASKSITTTDYVDLP